MEDNLFTSPNVALRCEIILRLIRALVSAKARAAAGKPAGARQWFFYDYNKLVTQVAYPCVSVARKAALKSLRPIEWLQPVA